MTSLHYGDPEKTWHPLSAVAAAPVLNELNIDELDDLDVPDIYKCSGNRSRPFNL